MTRADPIFRLRLPETLREQLEKAADQKNRSLTAEILDRLSASLEEKPSGMAPEQVADVVVRAVNAGINKVIEIGHEYAAADQTVIYMLSGFFNGYYEYTKERFSLTEEQIPEYWRSARKHSQEWYDSIQPNISDYLNKSRRLRETTAAGPTKKDP